MNLTCYEYDDIVLTRSIIFTWLSECVLMIEIDSLNHHLTASILYIYHDKQIVIDISAM